MMKVLWLLPQALFQDRGFIKNPRQSLLGDKVASIRLRTGVAVAACMDAGYNCAFASPDVPESLLFDSLRDVQVCVIGKYFYHSDPQQWLSACRMLKQQGIRLIVDISEFPFASPVAQIVQFYTEVLPLVDLLTVNSQRMASMLAQTLELQVVVIEDAVLHTALSPRFTPDRTVELLWFGHGTNLRFLDEALPSIIAFSEYRACCLTLVTGVNPNLTEAISEMNRQLPQSFRVRLEQWSIPRLKRSFQVCDLVLIPGDPIDPRKAGVSANRIAETLQAGRFPVASALESYLPFADSAYLGPDLSAGIAWALAHPDEVLAKITRGQVLVTSRYSQAVVAKQWHDTLLEVASAPS